MSYRLFRLPDAEADPADGVYLGAFATFDAALEVRDDDTITLLAATGDGEQMLACHHIVATGDGDPQRHPVITAVERRIANGQPGEDLDEIRRWLAWIHRANG